MGEGVQFSSKNPATTNTQHHRTTATTEHDTTHSVTAAVLTLVYTEKSLSSCSKRQHWELGGPAATRLSLGRHAQAVLGDALYSAV